jgi:hypothetical protein
MTPLFVLLALAERPELGTGAFGRTSAAAVRSVDPDANHLAADGAYGRFDGDLDLGLGVGGTLAFSEGDLGAALRGTARWYHTAGLYALYGETLTREPDVARRLAFGLDLTPLFLIRWSQALETGPAVLDLALDSLSLGLGASFTAPHDRGFASHKAFEGSLGFGMPLAGTAPGPWLEFRAALPLPRALPGEATAALFFSWHFAVTTPLVRAE